MNKFIVYLFIFLLGVRVLDTFELNDALPFDVWNDITIYNGQNNISFVPTEISGFISLSVHSPFNKIWSSLFPGCPSHMSQFGYHSGIVSRQNTVNNSIILFICSSFVQPVKSAVKVSSYSSEYAVPGGCGASSTDSFSVSTIVPNWSIQNSMRSNIIPESIEDEAFTSSTMLEFWTSTVNFYAASDPKNISGSCLGTLYKNTSFLDNIVYHLYHVPLVTCGNNQDTFTNPETADVLKTLSRVSSSGDTLFRGSLVTSVSGRDLKLQKDFSYQIPIVRHLGTASVINIIAEYKSSTPTNGESSTFVSYNPTILYTCPPTKRSAFDVHYLSNQLDCSLISDSVGGTRFCVGLVMIIAAAFALSGRFFVWTRCGISLMVTYSLIFMIFFYRYTLVNVTNVAQISIGILLPSIISLLSISLFWCCCIRKSYITSDPLPPSIFNCPLGGGISDASAHHILSNDEIEGPTHSVTGENKMTDQVVGSSSVNLFSVASLQTGFNEVGHSPSVEINGGEMVMGSGRGTRCCRQSNQYRLRRLARLPAILPAVFLISSLIGNECLDSFTFLRGKSIYLSFFVLISIGLVLLLSIYKNFAFGLGVGITGIYATLCSCALLFFPNSFLPYVLIDQFLILSWPEHRIPVRRILVYGTNDIIFLVVWLLGSFLVGLFTLCLLRLNDAQDHASNVNRFNTMGSFRRFPPSLVPRFPHFVGLGHRSQNVRPPPIEESPLFDQHQQHQQNHLEEQSSILTSSAVWPPQPFSDRPTSLVSTVDSRFSRHRPLHGYGTVMETTTPALAPLSRIQIAAAEAISSHDLAGMSRIHSSSTFTGDDRGHDHRNPFELPPPTYTDVFSGSSVEHI